MVDESTKASAERQGWWGRNWSKVAAVVGCGVVAVGGWVLLGKSRSALEMAGALGLAGLIGPEGTSTPETMAAPLPAWTETEAVPQITVPHRGLINDGEPFTVSGHVRSLPEGWHSSEANRALAEKLGVALEERQCYVPTYIKNA